MGKDLKGKELGKGITQRKDGRYQARFTDRFGKRRCVYGVTLKEVKNVLMSEVVNDYSKNNVAEPNMTLDQWYEKWMRVYKEPTLRPSTITRLKGAYKNHIKPVFGNMQLNSITNLMVTDLFNTLCKTYSKKQVECIRYVLFNMFRYALDNNLCRQNPVRGVKVTGYKTDRKKVLTIKEQQDFFQAAKGDFYYNLFIVAINTGLRSGELRALTFEDIDFTNNVININKTLVYYYGNGTGECKFHEPKTKAGYRRVPINSICRQALQSQIKQVHQLTHEAKYISTLGNLLFVTKLNTPIQSMEYSYNIDRIIKKANVKRKKNGQEPISHFNTHAFRHTFATRCFEAGIPPKTVQTYLGHTSLQMTMDIYTDVLEEKKKSDIKLLENMMTSIINF